VAVLKDKTKKCRNAAEKTKLKNDFGVLPSTSFGHISGH
jgi:hypothetical protein